MSGHRVELVPGAQRGPHRPAPRDARERRRVQRRLEDRGLARLEGQLEALQADIRAARGRARRVATGDVSGTVPPAAGAQDAAVTGAERVVLSDGAELVLRPITPADAGRLRAWHRRLSNLTRYRRFLEPLPQLSDDQVAGLVHIDGADRQALVAVDAATDELVGIVRFERDAADPREAAAGIVVTDAWQRRGVGRALADGLRARARAAGVQRVRALMVVGNAGAVALLRRIGRPVTEDELAGTVCVVAELD
jgi:RimJ/RimL family protein N-acetyltransferase